MKHYLIFFLFKSLLLLLCHNPLIYILMNFQSTTFLWSMFEIEKRLNLTKSEFNWWIVFIFIAFNYVHNRTVDKRVFNQICIIESSLLCCHISLIHDLMKKIWETQFFMIVGINLYFIDGLTHVLCLIGKIRIETDIITNQRIKSIRTSRHNQSC